MGVKLELAEAKKMKTVTDPMVAVSEEVMIEISPKGFRAQAQEPAWAVDVYMDKSMFSNIEVEKEILFHVKLKDFADFIKTAQSDDSLIIQDNKDEGTLELELKSNEMQRKFTLRLLEVQEEFRFFPIIDREFATNCTMEAELLAQAVKTAELGGEQVTLTHSKEGLFFQAESHIRSAEANISYNETERVREIVFDDENTHTATYLLEFLKHIAKIGKSSDAIKLSMFTDGPLRIVYEIDDDQGYIAFAIAPRKMGEE